MSKRLAIRLTVLSQKGNEQNRTENLIYPLGHGIIEVSESPQRGEKKKDEQ